MFSPEYDNPQRTADVVAMFERAGATPAFVAPGVVRAVKAMAAPVDVPPVQPTTTRDLEEA